MKAMILCAGRGERLRPLTDHTPKPLLEVGGQSLVGHHLHALRQAGINQVVINHAWLGDQFQQVLGDGGDWGVSIVYSPEPQGGLETAGGLAQALPFLLDSEDKVLVVNGDVLTDFDFHSLLQSVQTQSWTSRVAHLVLVPTPDFKAQGDFGLDDNGWVLPEGAWTFSGISVLSLSWIKAWSAGRAPLAPLLRQAMQQKQVSGELYQGYWNDVGTPQRLEQARKHIKIAHSGMKRL